MADILLLLVSATPSYFLSLLHYALYAQFFTPRFSGRFARYIAAFVFIVLLLIHFTFVPASIRALLNPVCHLLYVLILFRGRIWSRVLGCMLIIATLNCSELLSFPLLKLLGWNAQTYAASPYLWMFVQNAFIFLYGALFYVLLRHIRLLLQHKLSRRMWLLLALCLAVILSTMILVSALAPSAQWILQKSADQWLFKLVHNNLTTVIFLLLQLALLCFLFVLTARTSVQAYERAQAQLQNQKTLAQLETYKQELVGADRVQAVQRDLCAHLDTLQKLGEQHDSDAQHAFITSVLTDLQRPDIGVQSGNLLVDSIVRDAISRMRASGIRVSAQLSPLPETLALDDLELCSLLSNVLNNALEACQRLPESIERQVDIHLSIRQGALLLLVRNTCEHASETARRAFHLSSKRVGQGGLGLRALRAIAHSHGGELSLEPDASDSSISVRIYLPDVLSSVPAKEKRSFKEALRRG